MTVLLCAMSRISWKDSSLLELSLGPMIETSHLLGPTGTNSSLIKIMVSSIGRTWKKLFLAIRKYLLVMQIIQIPFQGFILIIKMKFNKTLLFLKL